MKQYIDQFKNTITSTNVFCLAIYSIFITFFLLHEGAKLVSFELTDLSTIYYSEGTYFGVDIGSRVKWMYRFLAGAAIIFLLAFVLLKRSFRSTNTSLAKHEDLLVFSFAGIILCLTRIFGINSTHVLSSLFFLFAFKLTLVILHARGVRISRYILHSGIFSLSVSFGFLLLFAFVFLGGTSDLVHKNYSTILFFTTILFLICYAVCFHQFKLGARRSTWLLLPLVGIPYMALLSVESFFYGKLKRGIIADHHQTFIILFGVFVLVTAVTLIVWRKQRRSVTQQYKRYIVPSLLFCYVLITAYEPVIENIPDMFEPANVVNSHLRVFEFGQIPVVDFVSSHMLSEQWYGYIYSSIFGFNNDLSSLTYGFLNSLVFVYVLYLLLSRLFKKETYAIAFIFLFPFVSETFNFNVLMAVIPFFLIKDLFEKPSAKQVFKIIFTCALLVLWRIDTGVVAIFGTALFLPIMYLIYPEKIPFKVILKGLSYFIGLALVVIAITFLIRSPQKVLGNLQLFYHYVSGSQSHGHQHLFPYDVHQFYSFHLLYPLLAVAMCLGILYLLRTRYKESVFGEGGLLTASLFLFILYIIHLQRGLVRHGFAESNDDTIISMFYAGTALFITSFFQKQLPVQRYGVFYGSTFLLLVALKYFPLNTNTMALENGFTGKRFYNSEKPFEDSSLIGREITDPVFAKDNYVNIKKFMDTYLQKNETFMDLSNTPMLYYYCKRKIPGYFNQNLENSIDEYQHFALLKELNSASVPMVISSSYPKNVNDAMDNIPNVMRYNTLFEYLYAYYKPIGCINHKNIWVTPQLAKRIKDSLDLDPNTFKPQYYDYKLIAEYLGYDHLKNNNPHIVSVLSKKAESFASNEGRFAIGIPTSIRGNSHSFLRVEFKKKEQVFKPYNINVELLNDSSQVVGNFTFERRDKVSSVYLLRLSNHYLWHLKQISAIQITKDPDILSLEILKDNRPEHTNTNTN